MLRLATVSFVLVLIARAAPAVDGVLEINQTCATHTGCFPGDEAGYPVTIAQAGSYRVTSNLTSPIDKGAITISAHSVTLDLGGFVVSSTNACQGYPTTSCNLSSGFAGIFSGQFLVVVRNGSVQGMAGVCVLLSGASSVVEHVRALGCGSVGIHMGGAGRVAYSFSGGNSSHGIILGRGGTAEGNESRGNKGTGIILAGESLGGTLTANRSYENGSDGMLADGPVLFGRNVVAANGQRAIAFSSTVPAAKSTFDNLCNGTIC